METEKGESADLMVEKLDEIGRALHGLELQMMIDVEHGDVDFSKILKVNFSLGNFFSMCILCKNWHPFNCNCKVGTVTLSFNTACY